MLIPPESMQSGELKVFLILNGEHELVENRVHTIRGLEHAAPTTWIDRM